MLAGLVSVPKYLYEAAEIDRASFWRKFTSITFPYIRGLLLLALLFRTIEAFKLFDIVFLLTEGGPGTSTETIGVYVYRVAFQYFRTSESAALAYILLFTVIVLTNLYLYLRQPAGEGGLAMADTTAAAPAAALPTRRRATISRGVGQAGWGRTLGAAIVSLIYFFPVLWIVLTAFKSYSDALSVPPKFIFTPTLENFVSVFSRSYIDGQRGGRHRLRPLLLQLHLHCQLQRRSWRWSIGTLAAYGFSRYPLKGNDTYLFIILSTRMLPADRGDHPDLPDVPHHRPCRAPISASSCSTPPSTCRSRCG